MISYILRLFLYFLFGANFACADAWVRGAATVIEAEGEVRLDLPALGRSYESFDSPIYFSGLFSTHAESSGSILIHTSNGINLAFEGEGSFSVERLEGLLGNASGNSGELVETQSRIIMSLRRGGLFLDSRSLSEGSRFILETPFGRISIDDAVLHVRIEHDYRSGIYDFTISCAEGSVRLRDLTSKVYTIYAGQRISGAGSYVAPAIEVAQQTEQNRESIERFMGKLNGLDLEKVDLVQLREQTQRLTEHMPENSSVLTSLQGRPIEDSKRPRVIKFAPRPEAISPFRGEVKPPTSFQAELF
ncbi:MAG: hypothetical protein ACPGSB_09370 [Opitutales bacterium]